MLAYVFWHRGVPDISTREYEAAIGAFHAALADDPPAGLHGTYAFRLAHAPWLPGPGLAYEDWYVVEDWTALGALNVAAVADTQRGSHDRIAREAREGAGAIYVHLFGHVEVTASVAEWFAKPAGETYGSWREALRLNLDGSGAGVWQRQMVLGPSPEFCVLGEGAPLDPSAIRLNRTLVTG